MIKRFARRIGLSFKNTRSERVANISYRNYNHKIKRIFTNVNPFNKIKK